MSCAQNAADWRRADTHCSCDVGGLFIRRDHRGVTRRSIAAAQLLHYYSRHAWLENLFEKPKL